HEPGGYRLTGRWPFASGCAQANWLVSSCVVYDDGQPRLWPTGDAMLHTCVLPLSDCEVLDTWYTAGLRGTGSHDFQVTNVLVPEERVFPSRGGKSNHPGVLYNTPVTNVWGPNVSAVALGIARDAIESFIDLAATKTSRLNPVILGQRES